MIAYLLEDVGPLSAPDDKRMRRLSSSGPWQCQGHASGGALVTWQNEGNAPRPLSSFGTPRKTTDGMLYFPPRELPRPEELVKPRIAGRSDVHKLEVETGDGMVVVHILPAYASPRRVLENDDLGDFVTAYARKARALLGRMTENPNIAYSEIAEDLFDVCRDAIMHTTRSTRELIADCGWLNEESAWAYWRAIIHVPKEPKGSGGAP